MENTVSIIVPVYNTPIALLDRLINSVLEQKGVKELILVDDGSAPECAEHLDSVQSAYSSLVRVAHQSNRGVSSARNLGLQMAQGEYIAFADADDALNSSFLESALRIICQTKSDVVLGGMLYHFTTGKTMFVGNSELDRRPRVIVGEEIEALAGSVFNKYALCRIGLQPAMYVSNCAALYRRKLLTDIRFCENIVISEDRLFNYNVFLSSTSVTICSNVWYHYIQYSNSASQSIRVNARDELYETATAFEGLYADCPESIKTDIQIGIMECFKQTLDFTVCRKGFKDSFGVSKASYVESVMKLDVYRRAFQRSKPISIKYKLLQLLFELNLPFAVLISIEIHHFLSNFRYR